jgi:hypothetical protein
MHKLITALVATLTILLAGSIVGKAEATPRPVFPLTKSYAPTEKVGYYRRWARRQFRRGYRRGYYGYGYPYYGYGYRRPYYGYAYPYYGYGYRRPYYGYGYGRPYYGGYGYRRFWRY